MMMHTLRLAAGWVWETSLATLPLIALFLLATLFLRKPGFTPLRHLLGLLVVARLLMPFAPPSPMSIFNLAPARETPHAPIIPAFESPTESRQGRRENSPAFQRRDFPIPEPKVPKGTADLTKVFLLSVVWLAGFTVVIANALRQFLKVRRWLKPENEIVSGPTFETLIAAKNASGTARGIRIFIASEISVPALFGFWKPIILLPAHGIDNPRLRMVFLHELAHIRRCDVLIRWMMILVRAAHWFNPLVWLTTRRLAAEQELLCDRQVMRLLCPAEQRDYAETLLDLASESFSTPSTVIAVSGSFREMKERILMIRQFKKARRALLFALPPLAAIIALTTFTAAVEKPALVNQTKQSAIVTSLISNEQMAMLEAELARQDKNVAEKEEMLRILRKELKAPDLSEEAFAALQSEELLNLVREKRSAERDSVQASELYNSLKAKRRGELRMAIPVAYPDKGLESLLGNMEKTEQQLTVFRKDYSEEHPEVQRLTALYSNINTQIELRIDGILSGLQALASAKKAVAEKVSKDLENAMNENAEMDHYRPYFKARRDLETARKIRDSIVIRILQENVGIKNQPSAKDTSAR